MSLGILAEEDVLGALRRGVAALIADPTLLNRMFTNLSDAELARVQSYWATHQFTVIRGYPVIGGPSPFPCVAMVLTDERAETEFLSYGITPQEDGDALVKCHGEIVRAGVTLYVYAEAPEACAWYYRITRVLAHMTKDWLERRGFQLVAVTGAELVPDPERMPAAIWVRRVSLSYTYLDVWDAEGDLYEAIAGEVAAGIPVGAGVDVAHVDAGGEVDSYSPEED